MTTQNKGKYGGTMEFSYSSFVETFGRKPVRANVNNNNNETATAVNVERRKGKSPQKRHSMFVRPTDIEDIIHREENYQRRRQQKLNNQDSNNKPLNRAKSNEDSNNNSVDIFTCGRISNRLKVLQMAAEDIEPKTSSPAYKRLRRLSLTKLAMRPRRNSEVKIKRPTTLGKTFSSDDLALGTLQEKEDPTPEAVEDKNPNTVTRPTALPGWLASLTPRFERKTIIVPSSPNSPEDEPVPISKANIAQHKGYLKRMSEKKDNGQRYWCALQDSCIYCYTDKNAEFAEDVIALGGYHVISETSGLTRSKSYKFTLKRQGSKSYQFSGSSQGDVNAWIDVLRRETIGSRANKAVLSRSKSAREFSQCEVQSLPSRVQRSKSDLEKEKVDIEKAKLLREVLEQQANILKEQKELEELAAKKRYNKIPVGKSFSFAGLVYSSTEDFGYCSSYDTDSLSSGSRNSTPEGGSSPRSLSTASGESTSSLCSIPEVRKPSLAEVNPEILAEIEEFEAFTKRELGRSRSNNI